MQYDCSQNYLDISQNSEKYHNFLWRKNTLIFLLYLFCLIQKLCYKVLIPILEIEYYQFLVDSAS